MKRNIFSVLTVLFLFVSLQVPGSVCASDMPKGQKGESIGIMTGKGQRWVEILQDGVIKRYVPFGTLPQDKVKVDQRLLDDLHKMRINSRVKIGWEFQKYLRVVRIEVIENP